MGSELAKIKELLIENGYPTDVPFSCINQKLANFAAEKTFGSEKCPVYLKLPWIGNYKLCGYYGLKYSLLLIAEYEVAIQRVHSLASRNYSLFSFTPEEHQYDMDMDLLIDVR